MYSYWLNIQIEPMRSHHLIKAPLLHGMCDTSNKKVYNNTPMWIVLVRKKKNEEVFKGQFIFTCTVQCFAFFERKLFVQHIECILLTVHVSKKKENDVIKNLLDLLGSNQTRYLPVHGQRIRRHDHSSEFVLAKFKIFIGQFLAINELVNALCADAVSKLSSDKVHLLNSDLIFARHLIISQMKIIRCAAILEVITV